MAYSGNGTLLFKVLDMKSISSKATTIDIGISEANRKKIAQGLSVLLADSYTLYLMTHNFHWNVTGPQFNSLHTMFMLVCPRPTTCCAVCSRSEPGWSVHQQRCQLCG
jgi:hypothetical protein